MQYMHIYRLIYAIPGGLIFDISNEHFGLIRFISASIFDQPSLHYGAAFLPLLQEEQHSGPNTSSLLLLKENTTPGQNLPLKQLALKLYAAVS